MKLSKNPRAPENCRNGEIIRKASTQGYYLAEQFNLDIMVVNLLLDAANDTTQRSLGPLLNFHP